MKIAAIIQARMGSTRLPGKVLMDISGKPMLWHLIERLKYAEKVDEIILAIPDTEQNDVLERLAEENNVKFYRGSEEDVLLRDYEAAKKFNCDVVIRITADCPLVEPKVVDDMIIKHLKLQADYTCNTIKRTFPRGLDVEIFGFETLEKAYKNSYEINQREHVTPYICEHPEIFKLQNVEADCLFNRPELRLTVDANEDLYLIRKIYEYLYKPGSIFYAKDFISIFDKYPDLKEININVIQKS